MIDEWFNYKHELKFRFFSHSTVPPEHCNQGYEQGDVACLGLSDLFHRKFPTFTLALCLLQVGQK